MYKLRVKQWHLDKYSKEPEMRAMFHTGNLRRKEGKDSVFIVRGRRKDFLAVKTYFERKGMDPETLEMKSMDESRLPRDIRVVTPEPEEPTGSKDHVHNRKRRPRLSIAVPTSQTTLPVRTHIPARSHLASHVHKVRAAVLETPTEAIIRAPQPSPDLKHVDVTLAIAKSYYVNSFDDERWLIPFSNYPFKSGSTNHEPAQWALMQAAASYFIASGDTQYAFTLLDESSAMLTSLLREQRPELLPCLLWLLAELETSGRRELTDKILSYAAEMSNTILGEHHPLTTIVWCFFASETRGSFFEPIIRLLVDLARGILGLFHPLIAFISVRAADIFRVQKRLTEAEYFLQSSIDSVSGMSHSKIAAMCQNRLPLAKLYMQQQKDFEAKEILDDVLEQAKRIENPRQQLDIRVRAQSLLWRALQGLGWEAKVRELAEPTIRLAKALLENESGPMVKFLMSRSWKWMDDPRDPIAQMMVRTFSLF